MQRGEEKLARKSQHELVVWSIMLIDIKYYRCSVCDKVKGVCECKRKSFKVILGIPDINEVPTNVSPENFMVSEKESKSSKGRIVEFLDDSITQCMISDNDPTRVFVRIQDGSVMELTSSYFYYWLNHNSFNKLDEIFAEEVLKASIQLLYAKCLMNKSIKRVKTFVRIAQVEDAIFYDLLDSKRNIVRVTPDNVEISPLKPTDPIFEHSDILVTQVLPDMKKKGLDEFIDLFNLEEEEKFLFKVHVVGMFLQGIPVPIMDLFGHHGKGKSTASGSVKRLVDPMSNQTQDNVGKLPTKAEDFIIQCSTRYLNGYDNISHITPSQSDDFCRMVTGSAFEKRKLYFNKELIREFLRVKFVINGIGININRGDFLERSINYTLNYISKEDRITEKEFEGKLEKTLPSALGEIFDILSHSMSIYKSIQNSIKHLPRMADFALWGESISRALGNRDGVFLEKYISFMENTMQKAGENHAFVKYIEYLMNEPPPQDNFNSPLAQFYKKMKLWVEGEGSYDLKSKYSNFPKSSQQLRPTLERVDGFLRELGYIVTISDRNFSRNLGEDRGAVMITIIRVTKEVLKNAQK